MTQFTDKSMKYHTFRFRYNNPEAMKAFRKICVDLEINQTQLIMKTLEQNLPIPPFII